MEEKERVTLYKTNHSVSWDPGSGEPAPNWSIWMDIVFILVGLGMLGGGFYAYWEEKKFDKIAVSAPGMVIDFAQRTGYTDRDGNQHLRHQRKVIYYHPTVQFTDQQGKLQEFDLSEGSTSPSYRRGDKVTVLYEPDNPEFAIVDDSSRYITMIIISGIGAFFILMGSLFLWLAIKSRKQQKTK